MRGSRIAAMLTAVVLAVAAGGCSTWDRMSSADKGAVIGAGVGGVAGSAVSNGSAVGTVGGAAVGGVIGHEVGKKR